MQKITYSFIFGIVLLLGIINFISASPPFVQVSSGNGYIIEVPQIGVIQQNQSFLFAFHVYNSSNGIPIDNASTSCLLHLYNSSGHILKSTVAYSPTDGNEWEILVSGGNFSNNGQYAYVVQCNSSINNIGGFESVGLEVNPRGEKLDTSQSLIFIGLFAFFVIGLIILISGLVKSTDETSPSMIIASICLSYIFLFGIFFIGWLYSTYYLYSTPILGSIFWIFWLVMAFGFLPFVLLVPAYLLKKLTEGKEFNNLVKAGWNPDDARAEIKRKKKKRYSNG